MSQTCKYPPLFLFVGQSASGKTTIANMLEENMNMKQVQSYTTRPKRYENEVGHIFVSDVNFPKENERAAYTVYNGYQYCATFDQLKEADIYVVDIPGVEMLIKNKDEIERDIHIFYFDSLPATRIKRMIKRGSTDRQIIERLLFDESDNWYVKLYSMTCCFDSYHLYDVDADKGIDIVYRDVVDTIDCICKKHINNYIIID